MKSKIVVVLFMIISVYIIFNRESYKEGIYYWDASGYYLYLPAVFVYHDLGQMSFYPVVNKKYNLTGTNDDYGLFKQSNGRINNKYAIGTAVFEMPFFLIADFFCRISHFYYADGYSTPYQMAGLFSCIFWVGLGLFFLRAFLLRYFHDGVVAFTIICIAFGTNIYCYTAFNAGMSHSYGFFAVAGVLCCTDLLYARKQRRYFVLVGLFLGFVFIIRPVNILVFIIPLFWQIYSIKSFTERLLFFKNKIFDVALGAAAFFAIIMIQLGYWKFSTGKWLYYSYKGEKFNFLRPHIIEGLFSYQKGWFIYTPIALVATLGLLYYFYSNKKMASSILFYLLAMVYVVFCWEGWWYGGGFSARALVETLPILSIPFAFVSDSIFSRNGGLLKKIVFSGFISFLVLLNLFQTYQYSMNTIHYVLMNRKYYWRVFGKTHATQEDYRMLMTDEEFNKEAEDCYKHN